MASVAEKTRPTVTAGDVVFMIEWTHSWDRKLNNMPLIVERRVREVRYGVVYFDDLETEPRAYDHVYMTREACVAECPEGYPDD